jgi:uncharacterized membrane protein YedE/YeeE
VKAVLVGFLAGVLFGGGLVIARMTDPGVVLAFLDVAGAWDPSLLFVMAGAVTTFGLVYAIAIRRTTPLIGPSLRLPSERPLDARLFVGTALFGAGWGLSGFCPGPAVTSLGAAHGTTLVFVAAMLVGIWLASRRDAPRAGITSGPMTCR